jgi:hypothetical protein
MNYLGLTISILMLLSIASYSKAKNYFNQELAFNMQRYSLEQYHENQSYRASEAFSKATDKTEHPQTPPENYPKVEFLAKQGKEGFKIAALVLMKHYYLNTVVEAKDEYLLERIIDSLLEKTSSSYFSFNGRIHSALNNFQFDENQKELIPIFELLLKGDFDKFTPLSYNFGIDKENKLYLKNTKDNCEIIEFSSANF